MTRIRPRLGVAAAALAVPSLLLAPLAYASPSPDPNAANPAFTITDPRITESSGLTRDTGNNVYWTVNDSGDKGIVYALGPDGKLRGTLEYAARPVDVEAVLMVGNRLYVGDIGDNQRKRPKIVVYYFDNPAPNDNRGGTFRAYDFVYPDGPHDAEAMLVDKQGRLLFVTKEGEGDIYAAPRQLRSDAPNVLTRVAQGPSFVTDGAVLPDGRLVLRSYVAVEVLSPDIFSTVGRAPLPFQPQGESIAVSLDGKSLLAGSEGPNSVVLQVPIPSELQVAPTPAASPPPSPATSPAPTPAAEPVEAPNQTNRTGTLIALLLALLVSLGAAAVVFFRGRGPARAAAVGGRKRTAEESENSADHGGLPARRAADPSSPEPAPATPVRPERGKPDLGRPLEDDEPTMIRHLHDDERRG
ncbi:SdiA-regulated/phytase-like domain-containing protein [Enemella dayhoffiae]|uniref:hypothetical protein n=1 Tax=Enemella dayhoffiae TaxID=2016507 RepID=UPI00113FC6B0|nr:hypothetical protein [Enemella dayhoffiae]